MLRTIELCEVCHGGGGRRIGEHVAPNLVGQNLKYMLKALEDLAKANRPSPTGMRSMSQILKDRPDDYLETVLKHLAKQTAQATQARREEGATTADTAAGKALAEALCAACHGKEGIATSLFSYTPNLAGQRRDYIRHELEAFQGQEPERLDHTMSAIARQLTRQDIENVAAYFESLGSEKTQ